MNPQTRRSPARQCVRWPLAGQSDLEGGVLDYGPRGVFLSLEGKGLDPTSVEHGTRLRFRVRMPYGEVTFRGQVRWTGWSPRHGCHGIGLKVDGATHEGEKYLQPVEPPPQTEE